MPFESSGRYGTLTPWPRGSFLGASELGLLPIAASAAISTHTIPDDGGYRINVTNADFLINETYEVHLGPLGDENDPICYSGVSGQGNEIEVEEGAFLAISPVLAVGGPYAFTFVRGSEIRTSDPSVTVVPHNYRSRVYSLRRSLPRKWPGHRGILEEPEL